MFRQLAVLSILLFATLVAKADWPRYRDAFASSNGKFEAKLANEKWQLFEKSTKRVLYTFSNKLADRVHLSSMTLVISDDGINVVAIDDFSRQLTKPTPEVIYFFRNGELVKAYRLNEVIDNRFISYSVSHFRWCFLPHKITINTGRLSITTNDLKKLTFDVNTGAIVSKNDDELLPDGAIFVSGKVRKVGKQNYEIAVNCSVRGNVKPGSNVSFAVDKSVWVEHSFYSALIIKDGKAIANLSIVFNDCG